MPSQTQTESSGMQERWKYEQNHSASPVFERVPSFAAEECHPFNGDCKQCVINEARHADMENISLHRRRQIREFEQGSEEPLSNKIRVWKEKRLEKSQVVRGPPRAVLHMEDEGFYQRTEEDGVNQESCGEPSYEHQLSRDDQRGHHVIQHEGSRDQIVVPREHHVISPREQHVISPGEQHMITNEHHVAARGRIDSSETGTDDYIRYLLTHNTGGPTIVSTEGDVEMQRNVPPVSPANQPITIAATNMPVVLTSPGVVPPEYMNGMGGVYPIVSVPHTQTTAAKTQSTQSKVAKKRSRQQVTGSNFLERLGKGRHESPAMTSINKNKGNKKSFENGADGGLYQEDISRGRNCRTNKS